jgi:hypothetical protein
MNTSNATTSTPKEICFNSIVEFSVATRNQAAARQNPSEAWYTNLSPIKVPTEINTLLTMLSAIRKNIMQYDQTVFFLNSLNAIQITGHRLTKTKSAANRSPITGIWYG